MSTSGKVVMTLIDHPLSDAESSDQEQRPITAKDIEQALEGIEFVQDHVKTIDHLTIHIAAFLRGEGPQD